MSKRSPQQGAKPQARTPAPIGKGRARVHKPPEAEATSAKPVAPAHKLKPGQLVRPKYTPGTEKKPAVRRLPAVPLSELRLRVLYEDNHLLVVAKPAGLLSQGDDTGDPDTAEWAKQYLRKKYNKPGEVFATPVHRLDRPVAGLQIVARTSKAAARLTDQFKAHEVEKVYYALVEQRPEPDEALLRHFLHKLPGKNIVKAHDQARAADAKESVLYYRLLKTVGQRALLEVRPFTGRQHQIRTQLAKMGCVIVGDKKYGKTDFLPDQSIALFAGELSFLHPVTHQRLRFSLPLPNTSPWGEFLGNLL